MAVAGGVSAAREQMGLPIHYDKTGRAIPARPALPHGPWLYHLFTARPALRSTDVITLEHVMYSISGNASLLDGGYTGDGAFSASRLGFALAPLSGVLGFAT